MGLLSRHSAPWIMEAPMEWTLVFSVPPAVSTVVKHPHLALTVDGYER